MQMRMFLLRLTLLASLSAFLSCTGRPPFVVLTVEDPGNMAADFASLQIGTSREALEAAAVAKASFPLSVTIRAKETGEHTLWVEALDVGGGVLGRGTTTALFARRGTPTATIQLARACDTDAACSDGLFCTGSEACADGMCQAGSNPCAANVECAMSSCAETGGGAGACLTVVEHGKCGQGKYCNPIRGCVEGRGCLADSDCQDEFACNGDEKCINQVCAVGLPPAVDDGDICTLDGCNDGRVAQGLAPVFHQALSTLDGSDCTVANVDTPGAPGVCVSTKGGCAVSACGDGVTSSSEDCDDGNVNPADGCDACVAMAWRAEAAVGGNGLAAAVGLAEPWGVAVDRLGNVYVADTLNHRIRKVAAGTGVISTVAGTGASGYSGDGGAATSAQLNRPSSVAVDGLGNVYVADTFNQRVRKVAAGTGVISTVAGTGAQGYSGDGGAATSAQLNRPLGVAVDGLDNVYVTDTFNQRIRKVAAATGFISTVAGTGAQGYSGDGAAATSAQLNWPYSVAVDGLDNVYVADTSNHRIRKVAAATGVISTVAGTGASGYSGDGGAATSAQLNLPHTAAVDGLGNLYVADTSNYRIHKVAAATGVISTVAGTGALGSSGDGGAATSAPLSEPHGVAVDGLGNVYVADTSNLRIRKVAAATGVISAMAGTGAAGYSGDGGAATSAQLNLPYGVATDGLGNVYVADMLNHRIRKVAAASGVISTAAGTGAPGYSGDGGAATSAQLNGPCGLAVDGLGNVYVADTSNQRIRKIAAATGVISTVAGTGAPGYSGDGGAATSAQFSWPSGVAVDGLDNVYVADTDNHRIRKVAAATGAISTVAGTGASGYSGDGGAATSAQLRSPSGVAVDGLGNVYIADTNNQRIRKVAAATGVIGTVAGTAAFGYSGDGGAATSAQLNRPYGVAVDGLGNVYVADPHNHRIRKVAAATGVISAIAGQVDPEGMGPIGQAKLADPVALVAAGGMWLIAGGSSGTLQSLRSTSTTLEVVSGRYPQVSATATLARFQSGSFGTIDGVAYDAAAGVIYLTESTAHRLHAVTVVDANDENTWTIVPLANADGTPGFADGALATARFRQPSGLFFDAGGRILYVADTGNHVIRALDIGLGSVSTVAGRPATLGYFGDNGTASLALLYEPEAVTKCPNGDLFVADTGNHRVRRVHQVGGSTVITTVLGDGIAASSGEGGPAWSFPVDTPLGLGCDGYGNLFVTSRTAVRLLPADDLGVVDGEGEVRAIYGRAGEAFPASVTRCLTGLATIGADKVRVTDSCSGILVELRRQAAR